MIGASTELFAEHSCLHIGPAGVDRGAAFTLVGRLRNCYAEGTWNE